MDKKTAVEILAAFASEGVRAEKLPTDDPVRVKGERGAAYFTEGVALLKTDYPNPAIRELMTMVWSIVGHRIVPVALGPEVPSLTLAAAGNRLTPQAIIFMPHHWVDMIHENPLYQLGALVFVGSQAVDYYNRRFMNEPEAVEARAKAYEAELLVTLQKAGADLKLNEWQQRELRNYPDGIRSESIKPLLYKHRAFIPPA